MLTIRFAVALIGIGVLASCSEVAQPEVKAAPDQRQFAVHVTSLAQLKAALNAGQTWIIIDEPIVFSSPADRIVLEAECPRHLCGNTITIEGGGGWDGAIYRQASFPEPLIEARGSANTADPDSVHWEFRLKNLFFYGGYHSGPALNLKYSQSSVFENLHFEGFNGVPFIFGCHWTRYQSGNCTGVDGGAMAVAEFRNVTMKYNNGVGELLNVGQLRIRGLTSVAAWNTGWMSGLRVIGGPRHHNGIPGPLLVENAHINGGELRIRGVDQVTVRGGYYYAAQTYVDSASTVSYPLNYAHCDGVYAAGSQIFINSQLICY